MRALRPVAILLVVTAAGCGPAPTPRPPRALEDKAALFADASLVPTREGERIRREVALAGELRALLESTGADASSRVSVRLRDGETPRVVAVLAGNGTVPADDDLEALVDGIVPGAELAVVRTPTKPRSRDRRGLSLALTLAVLGLGISLGVSLERARATGLLRSLGLNA